jgi:hypothetical protein
MLGATGGLLAPSWVSYGTGPLLFWGAELVHGVVGIKKLPSAVLAVFYAVMLLPVVMQGVVLLALMDSWYDFRSRLASKT